MKALASTHWLSGSLLALLLLLSSSCAFAPNGTALPPAVTSGGNVCSKGASLTNPAATTVRPGTFEPDTNKPQTGGIGGTGQIALRPGIGGTGTAEIGVTRDIGGIGGTGIVGEITGFASICVNGAEVHYTESTPVFLDGYPSDISELLVGQIVVVRATRSEHERNGQFQAQGIAVQHAAVGPLTGVNIATGEFSVMGQTGIALRRTELTDLRPGDWVRVSGYRDSNGVIMASRVQAVTVPLHNALARGPASILDGDHIQIGTTKVQLSAMPAGLEPGREILARGHWNGHYLEAMDISIAPSRAELGMVQEALLQGYVWELRDRELVLNNETLRLSKQTVVINGDLDALKVDQFIQVRGHLDDDGRTMIDLIDFGANRRPMEDTIPPSTDKRNEGVDKGREQRGLDSSRGKHEGVNGGPSGNRSFGR